MQTSTRPSPVTVRVPSAIIYNGAVSPSLTLTQVMDTVPDNGPVIAGISWFLQLISGVFLALRLYAKISRGQKLWWDDYMLIFSWVSGGHPGVTDLSNELE